MPSESQASVPPMIDHLGFAVADIERARAFYESVLAQLGYGVVMEVTAEETGDAAHVGFGPPGKPAFWLTGGGTPSGPMHIAFVAADRAAVDAFYTAAIAAGARDNGPPGLRLHYHPNYYAAFVFDPDGHNIEAVCHKPA